MRNSTLCQCCGYPALYLFLSTSLVFLIFFKYCTFDHFSANENEADIRTARLYFLSEVNHSRLHQNSFHLVRLSVFPENESYIMHLYKPRDLFNPSSLGYGPSEIEEYSCIYSVGILSNSGIVGVGSLSSCHNSEGFEGLISLFTKRYRITPSLEDKSKIINAHHRSYRSSSAVKNLKSSGVEHNLVLVKDTNSQLSNITPRKDVIHADPKELLKAYEEMLKDQEGLEDEEDEDEDEPVEQNYTKIAMSINNNKNIIASSRSRRKKKKVVELAVFTDQSFYQKWKAKYPLNEGERQKRINTFILALVNNVNRMYAQPSMKEKVSFRLVKVEIQKSTPLGLTTQPNGEKYLDDFCKYAGAKDKKGNLWDHAMMITGYDLRDSGNQDLLGIAFTSAMCLRYLSCSLVDFRKGFETSFTAAHEIGHTLGMEHDGEAMNKKCNPSKFIMAAIAGKGQYHWSACSNQNLKNYFASGDPARNVKAPKYIPRCLTKKGSMGSKIKYQTRKLPGQMYSAKQQCELVCKGCTPYATPSSPYNNICWMLHCKNGANIFALSPALEGTACGENKQRRCRYGKCQ